VVQPVKLRQPDDVTSDERSAAGILAAVEQVDAALSKQPLDFVGRELLVRLGADAAEVSSDEVGSPQTRSARGS
jgi:hypothetical protein